MKRGRALQKLSKTILDQLNITEDNKNLVNVNTVIDYDIGAVRVNVKNSTISYTVKPKRVSINTAVKPRPYSVIRNFPNAVFNSADYCFYTQDGKLIGPAYVTIYRNEHNTDWSGDINDASISNSSKELDAQTLLNNLKIQLKN